MRVPVIIDTDIFSNSDDVGALANMFAPRPQGLGQRPGDRRRHEDEPTGGRDQLVEVRGGDRAVLRLRRHPDRLGHARQRHDGQLARTWWARAPRSPSPSTPAAPVGRQRVPPRARRAAQRQRRDGRHRLRGEPRRAAGLAAGRDQPASAATTWSPSRSRSLTVMGGGYPSRTGREQPRRQPRRGPVRRVQLADQGRLLGLRGRLRRVHRATPSRRCTRRTPRCASPTRPRSASARTTAPATSPRCTTRSSRTTRCSPRSAPAPTSSTASGGNVFTPGRGNAVLPVRCRTRRRSTTVLESLLDVLPGHRGPDRHLHVHAAVRRRASATTYAVAATGGASGNPVTFSIDPSSTSGCTVGAATGHGDLRGRRAPASSTPTRTAPLVYAAGHGPADHQGRQGRPVRHLHLHPAVDRSPAANYAVAATATSRLAVTFKVDASSGGNCTVSASTVHGRRDRDVHDRREPGGNPGYLARTPGPAVRLGQERPRRSRSPRHAPSVAEGGRHLLGQRRSRPRGSPSRSRSTRAPTGVLLERRDGHGDLPRQRHVRIDADQAGNANYLAATQVQQSMTVAKAPRRSRSPRPRRRRRRSAAPTP